MRELAGKVAVVTGAASGIGRALALRFAAEGMTLMLADVDHGGLAETAAYAREAARSWAAAQTPAAADTRAAGRRGSAGSGSAGSGLAGSGLAGWADGRAAGEVRTQITDVSDAAAVAHLADRCFGELGAVHVLCNNAGVYQGGHMWTRTEEDFAWLLGVNLWGVLHGIRAFVPRMIEQDVEGHVVNTVSVAGLSAAPGSGGYAVSKHAALAASLALAQDLAAADAKLRVTALCPGAVRTRIADSARVRPPTLATTPGPDELDAREHVSRRAERGIDPAEVAELAVAAIREERFLVLTDAAHAARLHRQYEVLLRGGLPLQR
ncbi:SDR family NAD(P)-dependent oxidoreductase [Actinomadura sp. ATCC 31491]|uniref:SDR family NAD(P)-dependent oxidoreductase n=1 Tax=Actinomadura luzonensis TaxID=2805427 RepID=A0ABT0FS66_9ACTN|nr:SDR family NAD(P)-dependent oxidoreductase [Actinomadura luzonensis]MCK2215179.1 SDR family NAD(P)-dependent oxidoreductase [Actinomadura luzonensis]